jgi:hypothetical protein
LTGPFGFRSGSQPFSLALHPYVYLADKKGNVMRRLVFLALLLAPGLALAEQPCAFQAPRNLDLDMAGVRSVQIDVRSHNLHVRGLQAAKRLSLRGRACASEQDGLDRLTVEQHRDGDRLVISLSTESHMSFSMGSRYSFLDVDVALPTSLPIGVDVGSGDADVHNVASLDGHVGSGDLDVHDVPGAFNATVGSGDIGAERVGPISLGSVGSGDFKASDIRGDVKVGSIGSGEVELRKVTGSVEVDTIGSGDLNVDSVSGNLTVHSKGSGDIDHRDIGGKVDVPERD